MATKRAKASTPQAKTYGRDEVPLKVRGRPPKTLAEQAEMRRALLDATQRVFARAGYHALSVELVLQEAGLSRPTFYKYFASVDEAMDVLLHEVNDALLSGLTRALAHADEPYAKVEAALVAFRDWGAQLGPALRPLFAELYDEHSPVARHRKRTVKLLARHFLAASDAIGRPRPQALLIDTLIQGIEFLGYRYHLTSACDEASWSITRDAMLRLAFGMLATETEFSHAVPLLQHMGVRLEQPKFRARTRTADRKKER